jgi:hypothetical protein
MNQQQMNMGNFYNYEALKSGANAQKLQMEAESLGVMVLGELPLKQDPQALDKKSPLLKKTELVSRGYA